jgi:hypothetical protein
MRHAIKTALFPCWVIAVGVRRREDGQFEIVKNAELLTLYPGCVAMFSRREFAAAYAKNHTLSKPSGVEPILVQLLGGSELFDLAERLKTDVTCGVIDVPKRAIPQRR